MVYINNGGENTLVQGVPRDPPGKSKCHTKNLQEKRTVDTQTK